MTPIRPVLFVLLWLHPISINFRKIQYSHKEIYCILNCTWKPLGPHLPLYLVPAGASPRFHCYYLLYIPITLSHVQHADIPTHTVTQIHTCTQQRSLHRSPTRSSRNPGDGEYKLTREQGMKTQCQKKQSTGGKCDRVEDIFPKNQTVHIFIFAHRQTPTGHH